jgi:hypothetical protein
MISSRGWPQGGLPCCAPEALSNVAEDPRGFGQLVFAEAGQRASACVSKVRPIVSVVGFLVLRAFCFLFFLFLFLFFFFFGVVGAKKLIKK